MSKSQLIISPKTKVGELLDAYPHLENVLLDLSPSFAKLKNPILRKTVARIASLQQAAIIGGLKVDELVNRLRKEVGQDQFTGEGETSQYFNTTPPAWFDATRITSRFDATPIINSGGSPMAEILAIAQKLQPGELLELKSPFIPAPILDLLRDKGFNTFSLEKEGGVVSYLMRGK